jgi:outer membrane lipoprotein-sorting protein
MSDKPLVSRGKFIFEYPNRLRWEYQTPSESGFLIDGEKVLFWKVNKEKLKTRDVSSNKRAKEFADIMLMFISINIAEIEKTYIVERLNGELLLTSKKDASKSLVKSVRIRTDEKMSAVKEVIILSQKNEETLIMFSNLKINQKLPENAFKI